MGRLVTGKQPGLQRYLVRHDYGMGALWWWIRATSAAEITRVFAEVEAIDDPAIVRTMESRSLDELGIADAASGQLADLYGKRQIASQVHGLDIRPESGAGVALKPWRLRLW